MAASLKKGCAVDGVEGILEVHFEKNFVLVPPVALKPLARDPNAHFGAKGLGDADLEREEQSRRLFLDSLAEALAHQTPPSFPDSNWPDATILLS
jgi:hypothetical protein